MSLSPDLEKIPHRKIPDGIVLNVRVEPRSSKTLVVGVVGETLKIKLTAPPVGGAANKQLIDVLSGFFHVKKSDVRIIRGHTGRNKVVEVSNV